MRDPRCAWRAAGWRGLVCLLAVAPAAGLAGEPPVPPGVPEVDKKLSEEKPFTFEPRERRDPFTFRRKPTVDTGPVTPDPDGRGGAATPADIDPAEVQKKKAEAEKAYGEAEEAFMLAGREGRGGDVVAKCDKGLEVFRDFPNIAKYPDVLQVREKMLDLRRAGERMRQRQEAEKRFREMNIRLTGVVARERRSQAIVNGKTVGKGDVVAASENYDVVVDDILPDQVIFVFQGYKMMLTLSDMPQVR